MRSSLWLNPIPGVLPLPSWARDENRSRGPRNALLAMVRTTSRMPEPQHLDQPRRPARRHVSSDSSPGTKGIDHQCSAKQARTCSCEASCSDKSKASSKAYPKRFTARVNGDTVVCFAVTTNGVERLECVTKWVNLIVTKSTRFSPFVSVVHTLPVCHRHSIVRSVSGFPKITNSGRWSWGVTKDGISDHSPEEPATGTTHIPTGQNRRMGHQSSSSFQADPAPVTSAEKVDVSLKSTATLAETLVQVGSGDKSTSAQIYRPGSPARAWSDLIAKPDMVSPSCACRPKNILALSPTCRPDLLVKTIIIGLQTPIQSYQG